MIHQNKTFFQLDGIPGSRKVLEHEFGQTLTRAKRQLGRNSYCWNERDEHQMPINEQSQLSDARYPLPFIVTQNDHYLGEVQIAAYHVSQTIVRQT